MFHTGQGTIPKVFQSGFERVTHIYLIWLVSVLIMNTLSNSIKLNFRFCREIHVSETYSVKVRRGKHIF